MRRCNVFLLRYKQRKIQWMHLYNTLAKPIEVRPFHHSGYDHEPRQVIFLRHGQSTWNQQNIFIGMKRNLTSFYRTNELTNLSWTISSLFQLGMTDTPLTGDGVLEARSAGKLLAEMRIEIDEVYTSLLRRSTKTVWLCMQELQQEWVPVYKHWRLNERNYGALVGMNKKECVEKHGADVSD